MKRPSTSAGPSASALISKRIAELGDWRGVPSTFALNGANKPKSSKESEALKRKTKGIRP